MKSTGFTLIELMITIIVGIILLTIGVPGIRQFVTASAVEQESNNLFNALHSARSQAIALNQDVVLCYANTSETCVATGFSHLLIFVDKNKDGQFQPANANPDVVLLSGGSLNNSLTILSPRANYRFTHEGMIRGAGATFTLYNNEYSCSARKIILSASGRAQTCSSSDAGVNGCPSGNYCS